IAEIDSKLCGLESISAMEISWILATVAKIQDISIAEIDSKLCGLTSFTCIAQPNTTNRLDPLRETVMYKAPMRVFETHQAMVLSLSTDVNGADRAGVRWIELRRDAGVTTPTWYKYQEGTYAPGTTTSRWMPAINIDKWGNIIMAYSTSSNSVGDFPSLKMTGRRPCDPLNVMTMPETTLIAGTGSKTGDTRWGDYHHMCIDDFDGETFYYTGVYYAGGTKTRNIAVKMDPENLDAALVGLFQVSNGDICGTSAQIGLIIENRGLSPITSGSFSWQIGTGNLTTVNYSSTQLIGVGNRDTVFVFISGLNAGANNVNVSLVSANGAADDNSCNDTKSVSISVSGAQSFATSSNVIAQPGCTTNSGIIELQTNGGSAPFTFSLNGGPVQTDPTFSNLAPGSYTYSITDNTGCSISDVFNLTTPYSITSNYTQTATINCFGQSTAEISITATGGQGSYDYSLDGSTFQSGSVFSNLAAGEYQVISKDANGCQSEITIEITQPSQLVLNAIPTMITCFGNDNGSIAVNVSGGTSPYTNTINSPSGSFTSLSAGNYTITATDANWCNQTFNTTITEPTLVTLSGVPTAAASGTTNGSITLTGSGGLTPYTYSINGTNYYSGSLFSNLGAGTYTCYIKDANGCINTTTIVVDEVAGIDEIGFELVNLYPNPNNGIFELEIEGLNEDHAYCKLFNIQGQLVSEFKLTVIDGKVKKTIEMSKKLASGTYYLGIYSNNKALIKQFIKQ
ncbi:MAG: T9SS type A sorting domain-containing protein, partial [Crocinitomicaceae bacterium]